MVTFLLWIFFSYRANAVTGIDVKLAWESQIPHPTRAVLCNDSLWVYSRSDQKIFKIDPERGSISGNWSLKKMGNLAALSCRKSQLLLAVDGKIAVWSPQRVQYLSLQSGGHVRDISCNGELCLVLREAGVISSKDLKKWQQINTPLTSEIKNENVDKKLSPFSDWNEYMLLAEGTYSRVIAIRDQFFLLLDPIRNKVVVKNGANFLKWGGWGAWEGHTLSPKAMARTLRQNILLADPGLKSIFLFSLRGEFFGTLTERGIPLEANYPFEILVLKDLIMFTDVMAGLVKAYKWDEAALPQKPAQSHFRINLFRRPAVLADRHRDRCLKCHDGVVSDQWGKYIQISHSIGKPVRAATSLPLEEGNVGCISCHDPHHGARNTGHEKTHENYLRSAPDVLCVQCHTQGRKELEHPGKCTSCHTSHQANEHLLKLPQQNLCVSCHQTKKIVHRSMNLMEDLETSKNVRLHEDRLTCATCHVPHFTGDIQELSKRRAVVTKMCQTCHGEKSAELFGAFHLRMRKRETK